jgi:hypothetical protein
MYSDLIRELMKVVLSNFAGDEVWFLEYDQEAKGKAFR